MERCACGVKTQPTLQGVGLPHPTEGEPAVPQGHTAGALRLHTQKTKPHKNSCLPWQPLPDSYQWDTGFRTYPMVGASDTF